VLYAGSTPPDPNAGKIEYNFRNTKDPDTRLLRPGRRPAAVVVGSEHVASVMRERSHDHIDNSAVAMVGVCRE
jgi:hypothetical protein